MREQGQNQETREKILIKSRHQLEVRINWKEVLLKVLTEKAPKNQETLKEILTQQVIFQLIQCCPRIKLYLVLTLYLKMRKLIKLQKPKMHKSVAHQMSNLKRALSLSVKLLSAKQLQLLPRLGKVRSREFFLLKYHQIHFLWIKFEKQAYSLYLTWSNMRGNHKKFPIWNNT